MYRKTNKQPATSKEIAGKIFVKGLPRSVSQREGRYYDMKKKLLSHKDDAITILLIVKHGAHLGIKTRYVLPVVLPGRRDIGRNGIRVNLLAAVVHEVETGLLHRAAEVSRE